eukprot:621382-Hanusia_phi.AAC.1
MTCPFCKLQSPYSKNPLAPFGNSSPLPAIAPVFGPCPRVLEPKKRAHIQRLRIASVVSYPYTPSQTLTN